MCPGSGGCLYSVRVREVARCLEEPFQQCGQPPPVIRGRLLWMVFPAMCLRSAGDKIVN